MRLGFKRPRYVKTCNRLDLDTHNNKQIYMYIEWLCDTARFYGLRYTHGVSARGHYVEWEEGRASIRRVYTLSSAKVLRDTILRAVAYEIFRRNNQKKQVNFNMALVEFQNSLTPAQEAFWKRFNDKVVADRGW